MRVGEAPPTSPESGSPLAPARCWPSPPGAATQPGPRSTLLRGARRCAAGADLEVASKKKHAQTWRRTVVSALVEPRCGPGDARGAHERFVCRTGTHRGHAWKEVTSLVGTDRCCSPPSLTAARPLGRRRRVPLSSRGALRTRSGRELRRTRSTRPRGHGWPPHSPALSPHRPCRLLCSPGCSPSLSVFLSVSGHSTRSGLCPEGQSITCPVLTDFRIRKKAFIPSEFSPSLRAPGLKALLE